MGTQASTPDHRAERDSPLPEVSVVVVALNAAETLEECLRSLTRQTYDRDRYEVVVVDGGSTDGTRAVADEYADVLVDDSGGSIGHGRNAGVAAASGEYVAFTDADCRVPSDWLESLVGRLTDTDDERIAAVGGPNWTFEDDSRLSKVIEAMQETVFGSGQASQAYRVGDVRRVSNMPACNVLYDGAVFEDHSFADIDVGEDAEFHHRLAGQGYEFLYDPTTPVDHHRPGTLREFVSKMYSYGVAMAKVSRRHGRPLRWYAVLPSAALVSAASGSVLAPRAVRQALPASLAAFLLVAGWTCAYAFRQTGDPLALAVVVLLPLQYLAYGVGFLRGLAES